MFFEKKIKSRIPVTLNFLGKVYKMETREISRKTATVMFFLDDFDFFPDKNSELVFFLTFDLFRFGKVELQSRISDVKLISGDRAVVQFDFGREPWNKRKNLYTFLRKYYFPRYTVNQKATVRKNGADIPAKVVNISHKGAFVEIDPEIFSNKENLSLGFNTDFGRITTPAKVEWKNMGKLFDKPNGIGVQFTGESRVLKKIKNYIQRIEEENELLR
ncbi:MAG: PilZ domain-containing protein [Leptospiraceae bacterium]|nr:PilZ domain-containing protein [Leptospiraceae bacterium]